jgi:hypothetical protein
MFFRSLFAKGRARSSRSKRSLRLQLERLETRLVPTCSASFITGGGVLTLNCDNSTNQVETYLDGGGEFREQIFRFWNGSGYSTTGDFVSRFSSIQINPGAGNNNVTIDSAARPLLVNSGGGIDDVFVGQNGLVFTAPITVQNPPSTGFTYLHVTDQNNTSATTATLTDTRLTLQWAGQTQEINYHQGDLRGLDVRLGPAGNVVNVINTPASGFSGGVITNLEPGSGPNTINVRGTTGQLALRSTHVGEHVLIGDNNSVQGIRGGIRVENAPDYTWLDIFDQADPTARTVEVFTGGLGSAYGVIDGLAPAQIQFKYADASLVQLWTGAGGATVRVDATAVPTVVVGNGPLAVNVGFNGSLADIGGNLSISNRNGLTAVDIDDHNRGGARSPTLDTYTSGGADFARLQGLAAGTIYAQAPNTGLLTVRTGTGPVTAAVLSTVIPTNVAGYGPLTVNLGNAGSVQGIQAVVSIGNLAGSTMVNVNDQNDPVNRVASLDTVTQGDQFIRLSGLAPAPIYSVSSQTNAFVVNGGSGANTLQGPAAPTGFNIIGRNAGTLTSAGIGAFFSNFQNLTGGSGGDAFTFADGAGIDGNINDSGGAANTLDYSAYTTPVTVNLAAGTATGVGGSVQNFLTLRGGTGDDNLTGNAASRTFFVASPGNDTVIGLGTDNFLYNADANGTADSTWSVTAQNSGTLTFAGATTTFAGVQNLAASGTGADVFVFADGAGVDGNIQGSGQTVTNTLNYSAYSTDVYANLQTGVATGVAGGISHIQNVTGGQGNNILVGNGGNVLTVFGGHNLVIAGGSASTLNGGNGTNILIGGTTDYDADFASLRAILDFWNTVTPDNYDDSVNALLAGTGVPPLNTNTVHSNGGGNQFSGGTLNLYFGSHDGGLDTFNPDPPNGRVIEI